MSLRRMETNDIKRARDAVPYSPMGHYLAVAGGTEVDFQIWEVKLSRAGTRTVGPTHGVLLSPCHNYNY